MGSGLSLFEVHDLFLKAMLSFWTALWFFLALGSLAYVIKVANEDNCHADIVLLDNYENQSFAT